MSSALAARIAEEYATASRALSARGAGAARRRAAIERLQTSGLPSSRDENWKYANLRPLERQRFLPAPAQPLAAADLPAPTEGFCRYVFIDGAFAASGSRPPDAAAATVSVLADAGDDDSSAAGTAPSRQLAAAVCLPAAGDERFALLNAAFATDGAAIHVPRGTGTQARIELLFVASAAAASGASYPRVELRLEPGARAVLIERHVSAAQHANFVNSAVAAELAPGAGLEHYRLQDLNARSVLFDTLSANLAEDASYQLHGISTGAQSARSTLALRLAGERAQLTLAVASLGDRQQVQDAYAVVEHAAPNARTVQTFRGIAAGRARVAFNGKIVVSTNARGTDSRQSLRGLLAGPEAEIDVRPQLEIHTDDVRCSHGATAGKLDENMLFYLLSRGLSRASAQRLLKWAFLEDVIGQIAVPQLRRQIEERLTQALRDDTLRELL
jgi:Fe-S cluster assembly protein SufD